MRFAARAASRRWDHRGAGRCRGERRRFVGALRRVGRTGRRLPSTSVGDRRHRQRRSEIFRAPEIRDPRFDAPGCRVLTRRAGGTSRTYRQRRSEIGPLRSSARRPVNVGRRSAGRRLARRPVNVGRRSGPVGDPAPSEIGPVPPTSVGDRQSGSARRRPVPSRQRRSEIGRSEIGRRPVNVGRRSAGRRSAPSTSVGDRPRSEIGRRPVNIGRRSAPSRQRRSEIHRRQRRSEIGRSEIGREIGRVGRSSSRRAAKSTTCRLASGLASPAAAFLSPRPSTAPLVGERRV